LGSSHEHHYHFLPGRAGDEERYAAARRVTLVGAVVNLLLAGAKVFFGIIGHSQSLVADGVHSLSDLISDGMVLVAAKHGSRDADETHPYGHGRIETVVTVALGALLLLVAGGIMVDAVMRLFRPERLLHPGMLALWVAGISVVSKEALYHYTQAVARRQRSNLLRANAWHHRSDAISSVVVMIGVGGTMAGLPYLDAIAAVGVGLMIAKVGWDLAWHSLRELVDTALDADRVEAIRSSILSVDGVRALHSLRTRRMGQDALADVHILVDPKLSVSEGHHVSETVRSRLINEVEEVQDVLVHIDPEDDEETAPSIDLPSRQAVIARLKEHWRDLPAAKQIERITLHYLDGALSVEVILPLSATRDREEAEELSRALAAPAQQLAEVESVRVLYS
jgi:cation diffusion facilitator family transporter